MKRLIPYAGAEPEQKKKRRYRRRPATIEQHLVGEIARVNRELERARRTEGALQRQLATVRRTKRAEQE